MIWIGQINPPTAFNIHLENPRAYNLTEIFSQYFRERGRRSVRPPTDDTLIFIDIIFFVRTISLVLPLEVDRGKRLNLAKKGQMGLIKPNHLKKAGGSPTPKKYMDGMADFIPEGF